MHIRPARSSFMSLARLRGACVLTAGVCLAASPAAAQTAGAPFGIAGPSRSERPYRGIFGSPSGNSNQQLTLEASAGAGFNDTFNPNAPDLPDNVPTRSDATSGFASSTSANIVYSINHETWGFNASNVVFADYYPNRSGYSLQFRDIATTAINFMPTRTTRVTVTQGFKNLPEFSYSDFFDPELLNLVPLGQDYGLTAERFKRIGVNADLSQRLSSRTRFNGSVGWARGTVTDGKDWTNFLYSAEIAHRIAKGVEAFFAYAFGEQIYSDRRVSGARDEHPTLRFGVDYNKALSFTRRTTLSFSTGVGQVHDRVENTSIYHVIGSVNLTREFGRTWDVVAGYSRNVRYIEQIAEPVLNDSIGGVVHGSFSRRVQVQGGFGASSGQVGASGGRNFDTMYGSAQATYGITRYLGLGFNYSYSRLPSVSAIPVDTTSGLPNGSAYRVNLQLWLPLISQRRGS